MNGRRDMSRRLVKDIAYYMAMAVLFVLVVVIGGVWWFSQTWPGPP